MFIVNKEDEIDWPVRVKRPTDGGRHVNRTFTARFRVLGIEQTQQLGDEEIDTDLLNQVLVGWGEDIQDEGGAPLPFSEGNRAMLIDIPYVRLALVIAYGEAISGAKRKN